MSHLSNYRFSPSQRRLPWLAALVTLLAASTTAGAGAQELADSLACDPLAGVEALDLKPGTVLLLGELHGTAEAPALVADLACRALRQGLPLRVGLELPQRDTEATETYLASVGEADDRARLLAGELWRRPYQDGRSSQAMADLIEELRRFKAAGLPLGVALFDIDEPTDLGQERDRTMAEHLAQTARSHSADLLLVLTGNLHARLHRGIPLDQDYEPMGYLLQKALPDRRILAFDFSSTGGTAWICTSAKVEDCRALKLRGQGEGAERRITLFEQPNPQGFHGIYHVGAMSASPPAVPQSAPAPDPAEP